MLTRDADILCGEWQTGATTREVSGELYNVRLHILQIVKHPGFDASQGPIGGNDIAVFKTAGKVDGDSEMLKAACFRLPLQKDLYLAFTQVGQMHQSSTGWRKWTSAHRMLL